MSTSWFRDRRFSLRKFLKTLHVWDDPICDYLPDCIGDCAICMTNNLHLATAQMQLHSQPLWVCVLLLVSENVCVCVCVCVCLCVEHCAGLVWAPARC